MSILVKQSESTAALRRMFLHCVDATDGMTPETGEAGGQPQISVNGAGWGNTTNTLVAIGNGRYYVELTATELATLGVIEGRYKSAATAEAPGSTLQVIAHDPYEDIALTIRNQLGAARCTVEAGSSATIIQIGGMSPSYRDEVGSVNSFVGGVMFFLTGNCAGEFKRITVFTGEGSGHWNVTVESGFSSSPASSDICLLLPHCEAGTLLAIKAKTDNLPADPASETNVNANETKIDAVDAVVDAVKVVTDKVATALELDGSVYRLTANALELAPSGGSPVNIQHDSTVIVTDS